MRALDKFIEALSCRFRTENNLSDITWALCEASPFFCSLWLKFIFDDKFPVEDLDYIEREVPDTINGSSRVDFVVHLKNGMGQYIIENKIYDRKQHFGTYDVAYRLKDKEHFGYITNYTMPGNGYSIRQWSSFYVRLRDITELPEEDKSLIHAYSQYLKSICNIMLPEKRIQLDRLSSLRDLSIIMKKGLERDTEFFTSTYYKCSYENSESFRRFYFKVTYKNIDTDWKESYPYWGIWFDDEPYIKFGFDPDAGWCKNLNRFLDNTNRNKVPPHYCSTLTNSKDGYTFRMSENAVREFISANTVQQQQKILEGFFVEAVSFPILLLKES